jgi:hypothetical protein
MTDLFFGLFEWKQRSSDTARTFAVREAVDKRAPRTIPDPQTGRPLKVASLEVSDRGVCPACAQLGAGGYVSFESDLRLAFACPSCRKLVWIAGA